MAATGSGEGRCRASGGRKILRTAASAAVVAMIFWFALPRFASYRADPLTPRNAGPAIRRPSGNSRPNRDTGGVAALKGLG